MLSFDSTRLLIMTDKAKAISHVLSDYENNKMTPEHILEWVNQFKIKDRDFVLDELLHIFQQTYFSKPRCRQLLKSSIEQWTSEFNYNNASSFIAETVFLDLQPTHKSQKELLDLLDEVLKESYGCSLEQSGKKIKRYIYLDDVLSTGNTIFRNLNEWFTSTSDIDCTKTNFQYIDLKKIKIKVCILCCHSWGLSNAEYRLMQSVHTSIKTHIKWYWFYEVQNNLKDFNQSLNHMLPVKDNSPIINNYLNSLDAIANADRAYRQANQPSNEKLFSSAISRNRLETLFLIKGIEMLSQVGELKVKQIRPLGYTIKSHKTFGLGTLFFTYRNIPNNCPIVFWWKSNSWKPLFILKNRGE